MLFRSVNIARPAGWPAEPELVNVCVCVCVCVCVRERVCANVWMKESGNGSVCVCVCVQLRQSIKPYLVCVYEQGSGPLERHGGTIL